jgi:ferredoxin
MLHIRVDRRRCVGAGNCITISPTAFDWLPGEFGKAALLDSKSVGEELVREAAFSCPTQAIIIEELEERLPWQMREVRTPETHVEVKTFMFTDIEKSTNLVEVIGDDAGRHSSSGTTRRSAASSRRTTAKRSSPRAMGSSSAPTTPRQRWPAPSRFSAPWPTTACSTGSRRRCA